MIYNHPEVGLLQDILLSRLGNRKHVSPRRKTLQIRKYSLHIYIHILYSFYWPFWGGWCHHWFSWTNDLYTAEIWYGHPKSSDFKGVTFSKTPFVVSILNFRGVIVFRHLPAAFRVTCSAPWTNQCSLKKIIIIHYILEIGFRLG